MRSRRVIVELRVPSDLGAQGVLALASRELRATGFELDPEYEPVPMPAGEEPLAEDEQIMLVRGSLEDADEEVLRREPRVIAVWSDARVETLDDEDDWSPSDLAF